MPKRRQKNNSASEGIVIGDISGGTGFAIGAGAHAVVTQINNPEPDQITRAFKDIDRALTTIPEGQTKRSAQEAVEILKAEARKGNEADETKVETWINFLAEVAPDIWEIAINTFINPIYGVGTVFKKIAEKAKSK